MNLLYKFFLTINATFWVVAIYGIKEEWSVCDLPSWLVSIALLLIPMVLSAVSIWLSRFLSKDNLETPEKLEEANISFLPIYLGYFFVGLSIDKAQHLLFIYLIILLFTVIQMQYYNPIYLLFGYRFYHIETEQGTKVFLIAKKSIRNAADAKFSNLRRINDTTYIAWEER